ncbi:MAG: hypothetical protein GWN01_04265 [Nitrosopumilaceae archaeon]|nr:hypothetical protein [Nitrosopumilaceae archaeon]NIU86378.1 hypothetical protein [Nitrosopumilaceae archaeon]NIX60768.1 hypothetical protein [Nitrosopumilaceae archaeon]
MNYIKEVDKSQVNFKRRGRFTLSLGLDLWGLFQFRGVLRDMSPFLYSLLLDFLDIYILEESGIISLSGGKGKEFLYAILRDVEKRRVF